MSTVLEYPSYDQAEECLDYREALERYRAEKANNPDALVTIDELHCGEHFKVQVYKTKAEKDEYFRRRVQRIHKQFEDLTVETFQKFR